MFNLDEILQQKFASSPHENKFPTGAATRHSAQDAQDYQRNNARTTGAAEKKQRKDNFTKVEPYEYGSISVGDYIKYIGKNGDLKGGTVKKIQLADDNFEFDLARGTHYWRINNNNAKEIRIKYAKAPVKAVAAPSAAVVAAPTNEALQRIQKLEEDNKRLTNLLSIIWQKIKDMEEQRRNK